MQRQSFLRSDAGQIVRPAPGQRTPDHPPYAEMVEAALRNLAEEGGSTEESISAYIQSAYEDLPWGHHKLLPYYLQKLVVTGELTSPSPGRYKFALQHPVPLLSSDIPRFGPCQRQGRPSLRRGRRRPPSKVYLPEAETRLRRGRGRKTLRRRRGRPPLRLGGDVCEIRSPCPVLRLQRTSENKMSQDGSLARISEGWVRLNAQKGSGSELSVWALRNGNSTVDSSDSGHEASLAGDAPILKAHEQPELSQRQAPAGEGPPTSTASVLLPDGDEVCKRAASSGQKKKKGKHRKLWFQG